MRCIILSDDKMDHRQLHQLHVQMINKWNNCNYMSICCSLFCPSAEFVPYLASYLNEKQKNEKIISEYAQFSFNALTQSVMNGHRKQQPLDSEIRRIENMQSIPIKIWFLDSTFLTVLIGSQTTIKQ